VRWTPKTGQVDKLAFGGVAMQGWSNVTNKKAAWKQGKGADSA